MVNQRWERDGERIKHIASALCLEDPHNPDRDVGGASFRWDAIRRAFAFAHLRLRAALRGSSKLSRWVAG